MVKSTHKIHYNESLDALVITLRGELTVGRFLPIYDAVMSHGDFHAGVSLIWDATRASISRIELKEFRTVLNHVLKSSSSRGKSHSAWLFRNMDDYRLACMVNAFFGHLSPITYEVFNSMHEASGWIKACNKVSRNEVVLV